jgi:hypothetical protein
MLVLALVAVQVEPQTLAVAVVGVQAMHLQGLLVVLVVLALSYLELPIQKH